MLLSKAGAFLGIPNKSSLHSAKGHVPKDSSRAQAVPRQPHGPVTCLLVFAQVVSFSLNSEASLGII